MFTDRLISMAGRKMRMLTVKNGLEQELVGGGTNEPLVIPELAKVSREAAASGIVLLKNDGVLPLKNDEEVAVFGRCAIDYFCVGYGSGGDIRYPYKVNLMQGLENRGATFNQSLYDTYKKWTESFWNKADDGYWGHWPTNYDEMSVTGVMCDNAAASAKKAIVVIGRAAGEDRENQLKAGSYYLTTKEIKLLGMVTKYFEKVVVVLDCGNLIDMSWVEDFGDKISAIVLAWQGGMESGNALCDVLYGDVNPSARLTDTIAKEYEDYPSADNFGGLEFNNYAEDIYVGYRYFETFAKRKVLYPFGYGLSYTSFKTEPEVVFDKTKVKITASVTNTGKLAGKEVVFAFVEAPQGKLGKASRVLAGFAKTKTIAPGETETVTISFSLKDVASYDDAGVTGKADCFVLEAGEYGIAVGKNIRAAKVCAKTSIDELIIVSEHSDAMGLPSELCFERITNQKGKPIYSKVPARYSSLHDRVLANMPKDIEQTEDKNISLYDVAEGIHTMEEFVAQLDKEDLEAISKGYGPMNSPLGVEGNAGAFAGVTESLRQKGVLPVITADGPSGLRLKRTCSLNPCGTALASSFDIKLVSKLYSALAKEMNYYGVNVLLAPGMNIHRNPLCGRNFEYYSEDPLVAGKIAAAVLSGLHSQGVTGCPKHLACNNQEVARNTNDSRVSRRALREIYLKNFEIVIKEAKPEVIMASYNKINGKWAHYQYEMCTTILRNEWKYNGVVLTDWWMQADVMEEFPEVTNDAYRVRSQVDVMMPGCDGYTPGMIVGRTMYDSFGKEEGLTLGELQRTAINVLNFVIKTRMMEKNGK